MKPEINGLLAKVNDLNSTPSVRANAFLGYAALALPELLHGSHLQPISLTGDIRRAINKLFASECEGIIQLLASPTDLADMWMRRLRLEFAIICLEEVVQLTSEHLLAMRQTVREVDCALEKLSLSAKAEGQLLALDTEFGLTSSGLFPFWPVRAEGGPQPSEWAQALLRKRLFRMKSAAQAARANVNLWVERDAFPAAAASASVTLNSPLGISDLSNHSLGVRSIGVNEWREWCIEVSLDSPLTFEEENGLDLNQLALYRRSTGLLLDRQSGIERWEIRIPLTRVPELDKAAEDEKHLLDDLLERLDLDSLFVFALEPTQEG
jgi:hypothetical protein